MPSTWWTHAEAGHNAEASAEQRRLFPGERPFSTPKPERLMARIVAIATDPGDLVLDPFLGSATTAAVAHKARRRWIGIEAAEATIERYAAPRLRASRRRVRAASTAPPRVFAALLARDTRGESRMIPRRRRPAIIGLLLAERDERREVGLSFSVNVTGSSRSSVSRT